jgi:23S rRNA (adenine2503-C2)-methyltransferase
MTKMALKDIKSMTERELEQDFSGLGVPTFRARQVYKWLQQGAVDEFEKMTDLPKAFREILSQKYYICVATIEKKLISNYDNTIKYLFRFRDGEYVESVLMEYHHGYTICVSTQVGCKMGCTFCATGKSGFSRNLTASEMISQIQSAQADAGIRISNVVLMGMGEPLDNYDNVLRFLELVASEAGMNIGMRHISLSTCGVVDKIYDLADHKLQLTLSVSLHAPNDRIRSQTMPVNRKWNMEELLKACRYYSETTHRRISFEYAMISGVNDSDACARELAGRLRGTLSHVNLIPVNEGAGAGYRKSSADRLQRFRHILEKNGLTATVRRTLGSDINASCGQLRRRHEEEVADLAGMQ